MSAPKIGDTWTDLDVIEPAWWRESRWTVVATNQSRDDVHVWLLRCIPGEDGSFVDASIGIVMVRNGNDVGRAMWFSRSWVEQSKQIELVVTLAPGYPDPCLVVIGEHYIDTSDQFGANEHLFRLEGGTLRLVDELVIVEGSNVASGYRASFVAGPKLAFRTEHDGHVVTFDFDASTDRFVLRPQRRGVRS